MQRYEYRVLPFIGQLKAKQAATEVSKQLQGLIDTQAIEGWEFCQVNDVNIRVEPGCLGGLFGAKASYIRFDQIIFRRETGAR